MIATLSGILSVRSPDGLVLDVNGVGYRVVVSQQSFSKLPSQGERAFLWIHTSVREDDIALFGFADEGEKFLFQKLITVNGIGPKLALTILSGIEPKGLVDAVLRGDFVRLTSIPGVGKKTAERIVLDLKDKFLDLRLETRGDTPPSHQKGRIFEEAVSALVNLGYTRVLAERTMERVPFEEGVPLEAIIRESLKRLSETSRQAR